VIVVMQDSSDYIRGLLYCLGIAVMSQISGALVKTINPYMWALLYGLVMTNALHMPKRLLPGVNFCAFQLLKGSLPFLGIMVTELFVKHVGTGLVVSLAYLLLSLPTWSILSRLLGLDRRKAILVGVGFALGGRDVIAHLSTVTEVPEEDIRDAFDYTAWNGILAALLYPFLFWQTANPGLTGKWDSFAYGVAACLPEVSFVLVATGSCSWEGMGHAVIVFSLRTFIVWMAWCYALNILFRKKFDIGKGSGLRFWYPANGLSVLIGFFLGASIQLIGHSLPQVNILWADLREVVAALILPMSLTISMAGVGSRLDIRRVVRECSRSMFLMPFILVVIGLLCIIFTG
jgi:uncharacterized membrane protein YadS